MIHEELTESIIASAYRVYNTLGTGYLESVYQNAMVVELRGKHISFQSKVQVKVVYEGYVVGSFEADLVVEGKVILELKAVSKLAIAHELQLVNYLTAMNIDLGLLINFGENGVEVKRKYRTSSIDRISDILNE